MKLSLKKDKRKWLKLYGDSRPNLKYPKGSMVDALMEVANKYPEYYAYEYFGKKVTFRQFIKQIEAVAKCLGVGFEKFSPCNIEICHDKKNAPFVKLHDGALKISLQMKTSDIKISISHEKNYAIAFALAQN